MLLLITKTMHLPNLSYLIRHPLDTHLLAPRYRFCNMLSNLFQIYLMVALSLGSDDVSVSHNLHFINTQRFSVRVKSDKFHTQSLIQLSASSHCDCLQATNGFLIGTLWSFKVPLHTVHTPNNMANVNQCYRGITILGKNHRRRTYLALDFNLDCKIHEVILLVIPH